MGRNKHLSKKKTLAKLNSRTKWAPFWTVMKIYGTGRRVHPARHTRIKRSWKRTKSKV